MEQGLLPGTLIAGRPAPAWSLAERMAALHVNGVSIAVIDRGAIAWARGYGLADVASRRPVDTATLFQAASISKPVAATAALWLVQDGRLTLDTDVDRWLTSWHIPSDGTAVPGDWHVYPELAAVGLWTTPSDLARFALAITRALHGQSELLTSAMAHTMLTRQKANWGLGFEIEGAGDSQHFAHGGANEGFRCALIMFPGTGQGIAVMTNSDAGGELADELVHAVAREYHWPALQPRARAIVAVDPATLRALAGTYVLVTGRDTMRTTITILGDSLAGEIPDALPRETLYAASPTNYFMPLDNLTVTFGREPASGAPICRITPAGAATESAPVWRRVADRAGVPR